MFHCVILKYPVEPSSTISKRVVFLSSHVAIDGVDSPLGYLEYSRVLQEKKRKKTLTKRFSA